MKLTSVFACTVAAIGLTAVLGAQSPSVPPQVPPATPQTPQTPPATPQTPSVSQAMPDAKLVAITGCVNPGTEPGSFTLANAMVDTAAGSASTAPSVDKSYKLVAQGTAVNFAPHAGHKVLVTGTVKDAGPSATPSAGGNVKTFEARTVKMISASCS